MVKAKRTFEFRDTEQECIELMKHYHKRKYTITPWKSQNHKEHKYIVWYNA